MRFLFLYLATGIFIFLSFSISFPFIITDDPGYITENILVVKPDILKILSLSTFTLNDWLPLVTLYHATQYYFFGFSPILFRLCHITIYILSVFAARRFLYTAGFTKPVIFAALTIYAFHPLNIEVAAWLSSAKNIFSFMFGFLFLDFFLKRRRFLSFLMLVLAFMSKGTAVSFVLIAVLIYIVNKKANGKDFVLELLWLCVFLIASMIRGVLSMIAQMEVIYQRSSSLLDFTERMSISGRVAIRQLRQFFIPYDLSLMYGWHELPFSNFKVWGSWALLVSLVLFYLYTYRKNKEMLTALAIIIGGMFPAMSFTPSPLFQADRYFQITLLGLSLAISYFIFSQGKYIRMLTIAWFVLVILPLAYLRLITWKNTETVWTTMVESHPRYAYARIILGEELYRQKRFKEAEENILKAIELDPKYSYARIKYKELFNKEAVS